MKPRYLLDTNTVSYAVQGKFLEVRRRLLALPASLVVLSAVTRAELKHGLARRPEAKQLRETVEGFLRDFETLPWDADAADAYGELRAEQERIGRPLSHEDLMLAAHALATGLTLVTRDHAFSFVKGLKTEDWTVAQ